MPIKHSSRVQTLLSPLHAVPFAFRALAGQFGELPVQASASSHSLAAARQTTPAFAAGCAQLPFSQASPVQGLASLVQAVPLVLKASAGQVVAPPQFSATSHSPAAARHSVVAAAALCVQAVPEQTSVVQTLPSLAQLCPLRFASAGQVVAPPHRSSTSHSPTAGRHTVDAGNRSARAYRTRSARTNRIRLHCTACCNTRRRRSCRSRSGWMRRTAAR